jgi:hypothetical protein
VTTTEHHSPGHDTGGDPRLVAADARSILACPSAVSLVIEGEEHAVGESDDLGLSDHRGTPTFLCPATSAVARAAAEHRSALLTVTSGLGPRGGRERGDTLTLAGRLERTGAEHCDCCDEVRHVVSLNLNFILLARPEDPAAGVPGRQLRVQLDEFRSREHHLNRGRARQRLPPGGAAPGRRHRHRYPPGRPGRGPDRAAHAQRRRGPVGRRLRRARAGDRVRPHRARPARPRRDAAARAARRPLLTTLPLPLG